MQCLHDYDATDPLELSFHEGDVIVVIQENNTGWWKGELDGVVGLFPSNFTEELPANQAVSAEYSEEVEELDDSTANVVVPPSKATAKPGAAAAAVGGAPSPSTKPPAGAVAVMRPMMAPGSKPAALKAQSTYTSPSMASAGAPPKGGVVALAGSKAAAAPPQSRTPPPASAKSVARSLTTESEHHADGSNARTQVRAMYNYVAQERGELSLRENDVVVLLKKDDSGWWQGSVTYTGWFPASFVEELTD